MPRKIDPTKIKPGWYVEAASWTYYQMSFRNEAGKIWSNSWTDVTHAHPFPTRQAARDLLKEIRPGARAWFNNEPIRVIHSTEIIRNLKMDRSRR